MNQNLRVMKFGGTSVGDAECIQRAVEIILAAARDGAVVAVVSAMSGVTNRLIKAAQAAATGDESAGHDLTRTLREQHRTVLEVLIKDESRRWHIGNELEGIISEVGSLCHGIALVRELTPRMLDIVSSIGERLSARLVAGTICEAGMTGVAVDATETIVTSDENGQAEPLMEETRERTRARLLPMLEEGVTPVVTGFIGATREGTLTTLGRGGSDYSATILGAALDAAEIIIWTDVDGVLSADPRLVPDARTLTEISYAEAAELAYFGAKVLHPKTLRPVTEAGIPVWIRNSFAPANMGTKITPSGRPSTSVSGVKAITAISNVTIITVGGRGIVGVPGIAAKTFEATASVRANVLLISQSSSQNDICLIVNSDDALRTVEALRRTFAVDLVQHHVEHITANSEVAIVAVVGERMRGTPGIAGRTFSALGRKGINIIAIAQGSSEYNVSFVVESSSMRDAVVALHTEFGLHLRGSRFETQTRNVLQLQ